MGLRDGRGPIPIEYLEEARAELNQRLKHSSAWIVIFDPSPHSEAYEAISIGHLTTLRDMILAFEEYAHEMRIEIETRLREEAN